MALNSKSWPKYIWDQPAIPAPPGVTPNLVNPYTMHPYGVLTQSVCLTIATLLVWIRIYTKKFVLDGLGWEDCTTIVAWVLFIAYGSTLLITDNYGYGKHLWNVKLSDYVMFVKLILANQILYNFVISFAKLSIMLLYLRIFNLVRSAYIILCILIWLNLLAYTTGTFVEAFQCHPREKMWFVHLPGTCINQHAVQLVAAVWNFVSDFAILILPIASVWKLQMRSKKKAGIIVIFGTGIFGCIASIIRIVVLARQKRSLDGTWKHYTLGLWSTAEITCAIVVVCIPPIPAFVRHIRGKTGTESRSSAPSNEKVTPQEIPRMMRKDNSWDVITELERSSTNTDSV